jgi:hypothetical protein
VVAKPGAYDKLQALLPPVGPGRPSAGKPRTDPDAFTVMQQPTLTHIDWIVGTDAAGSPVTAWYDALVAFALKQTPPGSTTVPIQP